MGKYDTIIRTSLRELSTESTSAALVHYLARKKEIEVVEATWSVYGSLMKLENFGEASQLEGE